MVFILSSRPKFIVFITEFSPMYIAIDTVLQQFLLSAMRYYVITGHSIFELRSFQNT
jgi:hypothetical protein